MISQPARRQVYLGEVRDLCSLPGCTLAVNRRQFLPPLTIESLKFNKRFLNLTFAPIKHTSALKCTVPIGIPFVLPKMSIHLVVLWRYGSLSSILSKHAMSSGPSPLARPTGYLLGATRLETEVSYLAVWNEYWNALPVPLNRKPIGKFFAFALE